jgi:hypothetical protein
MDGETHPGSGDRETSRAPERNDLSRLCGELNRLSARYLVVGGFAVIEAGFPRFTGDIDLLIDPSQENEALVYQALRSLPDRAVDQLDPGDVAKFIVVRVADEVLIDLMAQACGIDYATAIQDAVFREIHGVCIPFASPQTLLKMKQTVRDKDIQDRAFLQQLIAASEKPPNDPGIIESIRRLIK